MKTFLSALVSVAMVGSASTVAFAGNSSGPVRASSSLPSSSEGAKVSVRQTKAVREKDRAVPAVAVGIAVVAVIVGGVIIVASNDSPG